MASALDPVSDFHHCIVAYTASYNEIHDIMLYGMTTNFAIIKIYDLNVYIKPDFSCLPICK